jgi:phosphatidylglycerol:prolipoprotein diacylglycerol transferase
MFNYPNINPIAFQIGPMKVYWYGIMYILAFASAWLLAIYKAKRNKKLFPTAKDLFTPTTEQISDLIFYLALGVIIGGRVGEMLFYELPEFLHNPVTLLQIWHGGMSFHGGAIGVLIALWLFARKTKNPFLVISDFILPFAPLGLMLGRIGNFINAELWGKVTTVPWGIIYPTAGVLPRHPSQIYEALTEGLLLFIILWTYSLKPRPRGYITALFIFGYGILRFFCEFFRDPESSPGVLSLSWLTTGQLLCIPMIIAGIWLFLYEKKVSKNQ